MASRHTSRRLDWILGKISSTKGLQTLQVSPQGSGGFIIHQVFERCSDMAHKDIGTLFSGGTLSGGVRFGLSDLKGLFQSEQYCDSVCASTQVPQSLIWQPGFHNLSLTQPLIKYREGDPPLRPTELQSHFCDLSGEKEGLFYGLSWSSRLCDVYLWIYKPVWSLHCQPLQVKAPCTPSEKRGFREMVKIYSSVPMNCTSLMQLTLASNTWISITVLLLHYFQRGWLKPFYCKLRKAIEQFKTMKHNRLNIVLDKCQCTGRGVISLPMLQAGKKCACVEKQMASVFY